MECSCFHGQATATARSLFDTGISQEAHFGPLFISVTFIWDGLYAPLYGHALKVEWSAFWSPLSRYFAML